MKRFNSRLQTGTPTSRSGPIPGGPSGDRSVCTRQQDIRLLSLSFLGFVALSGSFLLAGCGGVVANGKTTNGTPAASKGSFAASPAAVQFGSVGVGSTGTMPVTLINSSSTPVVITALSSSSALFTVDGEGTPPLTIAGGSVLQMNAHFIPTAKGAAAGTITITSNSLITPSVAVQLSGAGIASTSGPGTGTSSTEPSLSVNASTIAFGSVAVGTPATQSVVLTSNGSAALVVNGATVAGKGFTVSGVKFPDTLNPGQTATLNVQFDPVASGATTGQVVIASNAANDPSAQVNLTGTGTSGTTPPSATYQVSLNWTAPSGSTVAGYNVYRSPSGSSSYEKLNASVESQADYTDSSVKAGSSYQYYVTSVDGSGDESVPSNVATIAVP